MKLLANCHSCPDMDSINGVGGGGGGGVVVAGAGGVAVAMGVPNLDGASGGSIHHRGMANHGCTIDILEDEDDDEVDVDEHLFRNNHRRCHLSSSLITTTEKQINFEQQFNNNHRKMFNNNHNRHNHYFRFSPLIDDVDDDERCEIIENEVEAEIVSKLSGSSSKSKSSNIENQSITSISPNGGGSTGSSNGSGSGHSSGYNSSTYQSIDSLSSPLMSPPLSLSSSCSDTSSNVSSSSSSKSSSISPSCTASSESLNSPPSFSSVSPLPPDGSQIATIISATTSVSDVCSKNKRLTLINGKLMIETDEEEGEISTDDEKEEVEAVKRTTIKARDTTRSSSFFHGGSTIVSTAHNNSYGLTVAEFSKLYSTEMKRSHWLDCHLSDLILKIYTHRRQDKELFYYKCHLQETITRCLSAYMDEKFKLLLVGSSLTCIGSKRSDVDLCMVIYDQHRGNGLEVVDERYNNKIYAEIILQKISLILEKCGLAFGSKVIRANVPILKFFDQYGIEVNLNLNKLVTVQNSMLLLNYCQLDSRVAPFLFIVKLWARKNGINCAYFKSLSSYSLSLMAIFFLQNVCQPSVLPSFSQSQLMEQINPYIPAGVSTTTTLPSNINSQIPQSQSLQTTTESISRSLLSNAHRNAQNYVQNNNNAHRNSQNNVQNNNQHSHHYHHNNNYHSNSNIPQPQQQQQQQPAIFKQISKVTFLGPEPHQSHSHSHHHHHNNHRNPNPPMPSHNNNQSSFSNHVHAHVHAHQIDLCQKQFSSNLAAAAAAPSIVNNKTKSIPVQSFNSIDCDNSNIDSCSSSVSGSDNIQQCDSSATYTASTTTTSTINSSTCAFNSYRIELPLAPLSCVGPNSMAAMTTTVAPPPPPTPLLPPFVSQNGQSLGSLFSDFVRYYGDRRVYDSVISIRTGSLMRRTDPVFARSAHTSMDTFICVEEPFNHTNTSHSVHNDFMFDFIVKSFHWTEQSIVKMKLTVNDFV